MIPVVEWAVLQLPAGERLLIGVNKRNRAVIISEPLQAFAPEDRLVQDAAGTAYELTDFGLVSVPARRAWRHCCREHGEPGFIEVTEEYETAIITASQLAAVVYARSETDDRFDIDAYERTVLRGRRQLVADGHLVPSDIMSSFLGGPVELLKAISKERVFYVEVDGVRYFPAFFLDRELKPSWVQGIMRRLAGLDVWSKYQFFTTGKGSLNEATPIEALKQGKYSEVVEAAERFAER